MNPGKDSVKLFINKGLTILGFASIILPSILIAETLNNPIQNLYSLSLEDILNTPITTTSFFPESPLDVASTVSVITSQEWEKRGARRLHDALLHIPSVVSLPNFLGQDSLRIRGYAQSDARGIASLWDGVSITSFNLGTSDVDRPNIQLDTLDSIEVIRGPGSSLYGSDAFHGVVSLQSFESKVDINKVRLRIADNGFNTASYNSSTTLGQNWRMNTSVSTSGQPDQGLEYDYVGGSGERDYNYQSTTFVSKFSTDPSKSWSYKIGVYYDDNDTNDFSGEGRQSFGSYPLDRDVASVDTQLAMIKVDIKHRLSTSRSLTLESYYWDQHHEFDRPFQATVDLHFNGDEHRQETKLIYLDEKFTRNTQLSAALGSRHDKIDLQHLTRTNTVTSAILADFDLPFSGIDRDINSFLIDAKTSLNNKKWTLRYGFRLDDYSDFGSEFTPRFGAIYKLTNQSVLKALYGSSFRAATAVEVGGTPFIAGDPNIKPEELDTYELIYLKQTRDSKLEIVLFKNIWTNGITSIDTDNDTFVDTFANLTENNAFGVEITYLRKYHEWLFETSGSYVESESDTDDTEYVAFPKYIINLGIGYNFISGWLLYANNRYYRDLYEGPIRAAISPNKLENYFRTDLHLSKSYNLNWKFFANVRNLFDDENNIPSLVNADFGVPEPGISIDIGMNYRF